METVLEIMASGVLQNDSPHEAAFKNLFRSNVCKTC